MGLRINNISEKNKNQIRAKFEKWISQSNFIIEYNPMTNTEYVTFHGELENESNN